jgi:NAD(P)-dependent dehydrogenase (short-subunit alcohol dehydrogenase family)
LKKKIEELFTLKDKTVILTGSAGRLGSHFAETLASVNCNLILVDIDNDKNLKLEKKLKKKFKSKIFLKTMDCSNELDMKKFIIEIKKEFKTVDVLINNAHFIPRNNPGIAKKFEEYSFELWNKTVQLNLNNIFLCCKEIGKIMIKQKSGSIINISSIYGIVAPDQRIYDDLKLNSPPFYSATKGAIVNLTKYLASQWGIHNIRVNSLTLGGVYDKHLHKNSKFVKNYSNKTMIGRMANPKDYDGALLFLASDSSQYMTGSNLVIDGGWTAW